MTQLAGQACTCNMHQDTRHGKCSGKCPGKDWNKNVGGCGVIFRPRPGYKRGSADHTH